MASQRRDDKAAKEDMASASDMRYYFDLPIQLLGLLRYRQLFALLFCAFVSRVSLCHVWQRPCDRLHSLLLSTHLGR